MLLQLQLLFLIFCAQQPWYFALDWSLNGKENSLIPEIPPNNAPQPFMPLLAPSPLAPFLNFSSPKLSGTCPLDFSSGTSMINTTAVDCWTSFGPYLANVICCPQLEATLLTLVGQSSKDTGQLALDASHANHCLSDLQLILRSQGAEDNLQEICAIHPGNLTSSSCPVSDVTGFESVVDSSKLLAACKKVDSVNECCSQICQNAILEAAEKIAFRDSVLPSAGGAVLPVHSSVLNDCRNIVLRWLASRLDAVLAKQLLRRISNCNVNKVCPLIFPDTKNVTKDCGPEITNQTACCHSMKNYVSQLQKQSFITNLQALNCAAKLGSQLQKLNINTNIYRLCHITLKHFSLQVGTQESGCLLPSLPSDVTFDQTSGLGFTCDLNDNIAAPWPSMTQLPTSSCNKTVHFPALPAASSMTSGINGDQRTLLLLPFAAFVVLFLLW